MRPIVITTLFFLFMVSANAQEQPAANTANPIDTAALKELVRKVTVNNGSFAQATFSHQTSRGAVFTLPIDNMPCLVPDMKQVATMPTYQPKTQNNMPNLYRKQLLIPKKVQIVPVGK